MYYFGIPSCPYCGKRANFIRLWSIKKHGEYMCPRCKGISNIFLSPLVYIFAILAAAVGFLLYFYAKFVTDSVGLMTIAQVFLPFAAFFLLSIFCVYFKKPVIKKIRKTVDGRYFDENGNEMVMKMGKLVPLSGNIRRNEEANNRKIRKNYEPVSSESYEPTGQIPAIKPENNMFVTEPEEISSNFDFNNTISDIESEDYYMSIDDKNNIEKTQSFDIDKTNITTNIADTFTADNEEIPIGDVARNRVENKNVPNSGFEDLFQGYSSNNEERPVRTRNEQRTAQTRNGANRTTQGRTSTQRQGSQTERRPRATQEKRVINKPKNTGTTRFRDL